MALLPYEALLSDGSILKLMAYSKQHAWLSANELAGGLQIIQLLFTGDW